MRQVIAAGTRLLDQGGPDALTIAAVAKAAGVAVGSVYQRFGTKEKLLAIIQSEFTHSLLAEFKGRISQAHIAKTAHPTEIVRVAVTSVAETFRAHKNLLRVFMLLGTHNENVLKIGVEVSQQCRDAFSTLLLRAKSAIRRTDVSRCIDYSFRMVYAMCAHRVVHGEKLESETPLSWPHLIDELSSAVSMYLFGRIDCK